MATDLLQKDAVDAVLHNGLLVLVNVVWRDEGKEEGANHRFSVFLSPETEVSQLKSLIRERLQIEYKEQRLSLTNGTAGTPLFHGPFIPSEGPALETGITVAISRVPLDPRLEALYDMTGYGETAERDEITAKMLTPRLTRECPGGHALAPLFEDEEGAKIVSKQERQDFACAKCAWTPQGVTRFSNPPSGEFILLVPMVCKGCKYALCKRCWLQDTGRENVAANQDPYRLVESLAVNVGERMAGTACWFGGRGHLCGFPNVRLHSEFANRRLCQVDSISRHLELDTPGITITGKSKVLHGGAKLIVRFDQEIHTVMAAAGKEDQLRKLEAEGISADGVTVDEIIAYREALPKSPELWPIVVHEWTNRFPTYQTRLGEPSQPYVHMRVLSYSVENATFEISVEISDGDY